VLLFPSQGFSAPKSREKGPLIAALGVLRLRKKRREKREKRERKKRKLPLSFLPRSLPLCILRAFRVLCLGPLFPGDPLVKRCAGEGKRLFIPPKNFLRKLLPGKPPGLSRFSEKMPKPSKNSRIPKASPLSQSPEKTKKMGKTGKPLAKTGEVEKKAAATKETLKTKKPFLHSPQR
jgi:hypothetical protein